MTTRATPVGRVVIVTMATLAAICWPSFTLSSVWLTSSPAFQSWRESLRSRRDWRYPASLILARRSTYWALVTACLGMLPLVAWFAYAVPVEQSSDPPFFWASLVVPVETGSAALVLRHRRTPTGMDGQ